MAGHSRWAQIRHKKAVSDQRRGQLFSKLARLITLAAAGGGPNPEGNPKLRDALEQARAAGMSRETVERAIDRGSGAAAERGLEAITYEAYGPGGTALLIETVTDNPNRLNQELREILKRFGGKIVEPGAVRWLFERRVVIDLPSPEGRGAEERELLLIDAGAEAVDRQAERIVAVVKPETFPAFSQALRANAISPIGQGYEPIPRERITLAANERLMLENLLEELDAHSDIQEIYTNANL